MKKLTLIILICAFIQVDLPPSFNTLWLSKRDVLLTWHSSTPVCIWRLPKIGGNVYLGCYPKDGSLTLPPKPPADYNYFPKQGDQYLLTDDQDNRVLATWQYRNYQPVVTEGQTSFQIYLARVSK